LPLDRVLKVLEPVKKLRIVILDACRDNPFTPGMKRTIATRSVGRGLAKVEPAPNTLIAFAAKAGSTADDGVGANSPFTAALVKHLPEPGLDLRLALGRVRDDVMETTRSRQEPFVYGSLGGSIVSLVPRREDPDAAARREFDAATAVGTKEAWDAFLATHQQGYYATLARASQAKLAAAEKARADEAAAEQARIEAQRVGNTRQKVAVQQPAIDTQEMTRSLQSELRRVGCHLGNVDGEWSDASQRSLEQFNMFSGLKLDTKEANAEALDAVKGKSVRICPLACQTGFRPEGERCVAITCPSDQMLRNGACVARPAKQVQKPEQQRSTNSPARPAARANDIPCDRGMGPWNSQSCASDIRLKRDIELVGRLDSGLSLYSFRYLWGEEVYVGVMAQEVALLDPDAIGLRDDGYLRVNYGRLGLRFQTLDEWRWSGTTGLDD
jgi:uncharacterized caspase-like protein